MTQTLKFRALDTETNKWLYFTLEELYHGEAAKVGYKLENWGQWTGMVDKNGVEIYEGDILILKNRESKNELIRVGYYFDAFKGFYDLTDDRKWDNGYTYEDWNDNVLWIESSVVGNIYQNKELLQ